MTDIQDLNQLGAPGGGATRGGEIVEKPYDPGRARETVRGTIAQALVWTLVGVIAVVVLAGITTAFACHAQDACSSDAIELKTVRAMVDLVLTPLIGLVGAVTGFYFGEKSNSR